MHLKNGAADVSTALQLVEYLRASVLPQLVSVMKGFPLRRCLFMDLTFITLSCQTDGVV
jgi:hypothetical protein